MAVEARSRKKAVPLSLENIAGEIFVGQAIRKIESMHKGVLRGPSGPFGKLKTGVQPLLERDFILSAEKAVVQGLGEGLFSGGKGESNRPRAADILSFVLQTLQCLHPWDILLMAHSSSSDTHIKAPPILGLLMAMRPEEGENLRVAH